MNVGLVGYGRFGKLAAIHLARHAEVFVFDRKRFTSRLPSRRIHRASLERAASQPVVILAVPVSSLRQTLLAIRSHVQPGAIIADVCAVKAFPSRWMRKILPPSVNILGTHPLFGPDSASGSLRGHTIVLCPVRMPVSLLEKTRRMLRQAGLRPAIMDPDKHDKMVAETILLTQYIGRLVGHARLGRWGLATKSYTSLLSVVEVAIHDSPQLFSDMVRYNKYARRCISALRGAHRQLLIELGEH
jgi:prephenate dehydrogenase